MLGQREVQDQPASFTLRIPPPKMTTAREELDILREAVSRDPESSEYRYQLAALLYILDNFDEAVDILRSMSTDVSEFRVYDLLGDVLLARETEQDTIEAKRYAQRAVDAALDSGQRARALASLGKAHLRLSELDEGRSRLTEALAEKVTNKDAFKRLAMLDFRTNRVQEASDYTEQMVANGVSHARVLGVRPLAFAKLGRIDEAREAFGLEPFLQQTFLPPPPGWSTIQAFNKDLASELLAHPGIRYDRYGAASTHTWRIDEPALARSRLVPILHQLLKREVTAYVSRLSRNGGPWLRARPSEAALYSWCVMTDGDGFEEWHVHQNGWLSGVYYVEVPDFIVNGSGSQGCIEFGLPPNIVGEDRSAQFGDTFFRPQSGMLVLFPAHAYHCTIPHRGDRRRICFAFDIGPEY